MASIADMTLDDLRHFVEQTLDERLTRVLGAFEQPTPSDSDESSSWDMVRDMAERYRWTPPSGTKSGLQMLREDREG